MTTDFSTRGQRQRLHPLDAALVALALALLAVSAASAWRAWSGLRRSEALLAEAQQALQSDQNRMAELTSQRGTAGKEAVARAELTFAAPPARVLADLEQALPAAVRLDGVTLAYGESLDVEIRVLARTPEAYDRFIERLGAGGRFVDLTFGAETRTADMKATVKARYRDEAES